MPNIKHSSLEYSGGGGIHPIAAVSYADASDRESHTDPSGVPWEDEAAADLPLGLVAFQENTKSYWILAINAAGTLTWQALSNEESLTHQDFPLTYDAILFRTGPKTYTAVRTELNSTSAPTASLDDTLGFVAGSRILDTTNGEEYVCLDPATGAAVWKRTTVVERPDVQRAEIEVATGTWLFHWPIPYDCTVQSVGVRATTADVTSAGAGGGADVYIAKNNIGGTAILDTGAGDTDVLISDNRLELDLSTTPADLDLDAGDCIFGQVAFPGGVTGGTSILVVDVVYGPR